MADPLLLLLYTPTMTKGNQTVRKINPQTSQMGIDLFLRLFTRKKLIYAVNVY